MSERYTIQHLIEVAQGDQELVEELYEAEILVRDRDLTQVDVERCRVAYSLRRELEVNLPGVEVILRMREELMTTKRKLARLTVLFGKALTEVDELGNDLAELGDELRELEDDSE